MQQRAQLKNAVLKLTAASFEETALAVFRYQAATNPLYAQFLSLLKVAPEKVERLSQIPFLPISFFKTHQLQSASWSPEMTFTSSGTTGAQTSRHLIRDLAFYRQLSIQGFKDSYGPLADYCILALLPSYLERSGSSLVYMVEAFSKEAKPESGFFLHDLEALREQILHCQQRNIPVLLIGVSFALLDMAERYPMDLSEVIVMETGGMKGRRRELTRGELHQQLKAAFGVEKIHSEYGMTELLSQAWSQGDGLFRCSRSMRVFTREINDPFGTPPLGRPGVLNLIDLGNLDTISFIATDDLGRIHADGHFEVLGRLDGSDIRGCNLLVGEE